MGSVVRMKIRMCLINPKTAVLVPDMRICVYDRARFWLAQPGRPLSSGGRAGSSQIRRGEVEIAVAMDGEGRVLSEAGCRA